MTAKSVAKPAKTAASVKKTAQGRPVEYLTEAELAQKREQYEERAGIKEFCANMPRDQAEQEAWLEIYRRKP